MCGIVAMFSKDSAVSAEPLERATKALHHRGPDGQKVWVAPHRRIGLGHARLAIIDLAGGDQPIANEDESLRCIVNGEFYDFERIQRELVARGHKLRTKSDSEILLHLYEERGTHCFDDLRGEFAFVLWDEKNQSVFAGRDRFGIKPLYYAWNGSTLHLASEVKALFASGVPAKWDVDSLLMSCQLYTEPDRSLYQNVFQVPPGHYLVATKSQTRLQRYWDIDFPKEDAPAEKLSEREWIDRVRDSIDEAVKLRLRADVPVGFYLSGGIDSCAIVGTAAKFLKAPFDAFTVSFQEDTTWDEEAAANEMAKRTGARFHSLRVTDQDLADHFSDAVFHSEILPANESGVGKFLLSRLVRSKDIRVVLSGEGGDELYAGYAHFRRDQLLDQPLSEAEKAKQLAELAQKNTASRGTLFPAGEALSTESIRGTLGFVPSWIEAAAALGAKLRTFMDDGALGDLAARDNFKLYMTGVDVHGQLRGRSRLNQARYTFTKGYMHNYILVWLGDRAEMAHSVEGRTPLLDHKMMELTRRLPPELMIKGTTEKYALREAVKDVVPESVYRRQKHPFTAPPAGLRPKGGVHAMVQDVLRGPLLDSLPLFDAKKIRAFLDQLHTMEPRDRQDWSFPLMRVVGACLLQKHFKL